MASSRGPRCILKSVRIFNSKVRSKCSTTGAKYLSSWTLYPVSLYLQKHFHCLTAKIRQLKWQETVLMRTDHKVQLKSPPQSAAALNRSRKVQCSNYSRVTTKNNSHGAVKHRVDFSNWKTSRWQKYAGRTRVIFSSRIPLAGKCTYQKKLTQLFWCERDGNAC